MKKNITAIHKSLQTTYLKISFFFLFFLLNFTVLSQDNKILLDSQLTTRQSDSIKSSLLYDKGREAANQNNHEEALNYFLESLSYRRKIYPENHIFIAFALNRAGTEYKELGRLNEAIDCFKEVIKINTYNYTENTWRNGTPYNNLGIVYQQKGNFRDAIEYYEQAIKYSSLGDLADPLIQEVIIKEKYNLANNLHFTDQFNEALEIILGCYKNTPYYDKASFLSLLGNIYVFLKNNSKAREYYKLSVNELEENALDLQDSINLAELYTVFSLFLISTNEFAEADKNLTKASVLLSETITGLDKSNLLFAFGELYSKKSFDSNSFGYFKKIKVDNLNTALNYYQKAIIAISDNFTNSTPTSNPLIEQCLFKARTLQILQRKTETYYELAQLNNENNSLKLLDLENSLSAINLASDLLNNLRSETVSEESKILMTQLQNSIYLFSVKIAGELFRITNKTEYFEIAFQNAERNKAASLLDNLTNEKAQKGSFIPDSLVRKEENINDQISVINQKLFDENQSKNPDSLIIQKYKEQLFRLEHDKNDLIYFLEENFRDYYQLKYADNKITIKEIQKKISKDEIILEYVYDKSPNAYNNDLYIFLISKNEFDLKKISVDSSYFNDIDVMYQFLSATDFINIPFEKYNNYLVSANNLYKLLIKPVEEKIANLSVTVIPDGKLNYIPFDALLYGLPEKTDKLDFKNLDYLVRKFSFNYSYSANLYLNKFNTEKRANKKLLAFAPVFGDYNQFGDSEFNRLTPLAGIMDEVNSIAKYIKSKLFTGGEATESNFIKNYKNYDILHLAMHAILNDSLPMFSKLAFSPENDTAITEDGWLTTTEIYNLKLNSRLSVLSACNTGSGKLSEGEGVISLARGFFYAGCPSIVMTLWEVEDRSGAEIMSEFYRLLNAGKKKNEALRLAKLKHIEEANPVTAHPHVWLCYVTIGNTDALYSGNDFYFFILILVILVGVVIDQLYKNKKARETRA